MVKEAYDAGIFSRESIYPIPFLDQFPGSARTDGCDTDNPAMKSNLPAGYITFRINTESTPDLDGKRLYLNFVLGDYDASDTKLEITIPSLDTKTFSIPRTPMLSNGGIQSESIDLLDLFDLNSIMDILTPAGTNLYKCVLNISFIKENPDGSSVLSNEPYMVFDFLEVATDRRSIGGVTVYSGSPEVEVHDFDDIQSAITLACPGDTIFARTGIYDPINVGGKNITIRAINPAATEPNEFKESRIHVGNYTSSAVQFSGDENITCMLRGFRITGGEAERGGGIFGGEDGTHAIITECEIDSNIAYLCGGGTYKCRNLYRNYIHDNRAGYTGGGVFLGPGPCVVINNIINENSRDVALRQGNIGDIIPCYQPYSNTDCPSCAGDEIIIEHDAAGLYLQGFPLDRLGSEDTHIYFNEFVNNDDQSEFRKKEYSCSQEKVCYNNLLDDGGFECGPPPDSKWTVSSNSLNDNPAVLETSDARTGDYCLNIHSEMSFPLTAEVKQISFQIAPGSDATLSFYLWFNASRIGGTGIFEVYIDSTSYFSVREDSTEYSGGYHLVPGIDVSDCADGNTHTVSFVATLDQADTEFTDIYIDDICLQADTRCATLGPLPAMGPEELYDCGYTGIQDSIFAKNCIVWGPCDVNEYNDDDYQEDGEGEDCCGPEGEWVDNPDLEDWLRYCLVKAGPGVMPRDDKQCGCGTLGRTTWSSNSNAIQDGGFECLFSGETPSVWQVAASHSAATLPQAVPYGPIACAPPPPRSPLPRSRNWCCDEISWLNCR